MPHHCDSARRVTHFAGIAACRLCRVAARPLEVRMRRLVIALITLVILIALIPGAAAQEISGDGLWNLFSAINDPDLDVSEGALIIDGDGGVFLPSQFTGDLGLALAVDFSMAMQPIDDTGDGVDAAINITRAWGNTVHVSDAALDYISPNFNGFSLNTGLGVASPFDGTPAVLHSESVLFGVETEEPVTDDEEPWQLQVSLRYQFNLTYNRVGNTPSDSDDVNGGHDASNDMYLSDGIFGMGAWDFSAGNFTPRLTEFFGAARNNRLWFGGPWGELDGGSGFELNVGDYPAFDTVVLGDIDDLGIISIYLASEMDFAAGEEPPANEEQPPADEPEQPAADEPEQPSAQNEEPPTQSDTAQATDTTNANGLSPALIIGGIVVVAGGLFGVIWLLRKKEDEECVPQAQMLALAKTRVGEKRAAVETAKAKVKKATDHKKYTEANATEQREQRILEAQGQIDAANRELADAEDELRDADADEATAQHEYNVCMGLVTPAPEPEPDPPQAGPPPRPAMPDAPPPVIPTPTAVEQGASGRPAISETPGESTSTSTAPPPPGSKPDECEGNERNEVDGPLETFTVPVDGMVRFFLTREGSPLEPLEDVVSDSSIADQLANQLTEFLTPEALTLPADSLGPRKAAAWEKALNKLGLAAQGNVELVMEYDLVEVSMVCVRIDECQNNHWVTVGHRLEERGRGEPTPVTSTWQPGLAPRGLGVEITGIQNGLRKANKAKTNMDAFIAGCK